MQTESSEEKKALINMAQFVFRREAESVRDNIYDGIVELAVFSKGESGIAISDIPHAMAAIYPIEVHETVIKESVRRLASTDALLLKKKDLYVVSPERNTILQESTNLKKARIELLSESFEQELKSIIGRKLTEDEEELAKKKLFVFVTNFFVPRSKVTAALLVGKKVEFGDTLQLETAFKSSLSDIGNVNLKGAVKRAIINIFQKINPQLTEVLFDIVQNIYLLEVLNLDPDCKCLQKAEFSKITFLLDTNTIVSLLCTTDERRHKIASDFNNICRILGTQLQVSNLTISEYRHLLENSNVLYGSIKVPPALLGDYPDPFISSFAEETKINTKETWEGYYLRMKRLGGDIGNTFGIKQFDYDWNKIFEMTYFEEIVQAVKDCSEKWRGSPKHEEVARHDAAHMIIVKETRKSKDATIFGPNLWFATLDHTLPCAESVLDKYYKDMLPSLYKGV